MENKEKQQSTEDTRCQTVGEIMADAVNRNSALTAIIVREGLLHGPSTLSDIKASFRKVLDRDTISKGWDSETREAAATFGAGMFVAGISFGRLFGDESKAEARRRADADPEEQVLFERVYRKIEPMLERLDAQDALETLLAGVDQ